jgi:hypothetical protein
MESTDNQMTSPIKPGRWKSADEILEKIGSVTRRIARYRLAADELFVKSKKAAIEQAKWKDEGLSYQDKAKVYRDTGQEKLDKADRLENGYLQKLKRKLAQMQTELLPMEGNTDTSIPKQ